MQCPFCFEKDEKKMANVDASDGKDANCNLWTLHYSRKSRIWGWGGEQKKKVWGWGNEFKFLKKKSSSMCVVAIIHKNSYARKY
jgi:hypothetical protein